jgi:DNA-binding CsgD family transcriptional regulator
MTTIVVMVGDWRQSQLHVTRFGCKGGRMDVHLIQERSFAYDPLRRDIGQLVATVATSRFEPQLFGLLEKAVRCEHLTAFAISAPRQARLIFAANRGNSPIARSAANTYLNSYWSADPTNRVLAERSDLTQGVVACVSADEMLRLQYRRACYTSTDWARNGCNLIHKVTVIKQYESHTFKINLYRHRKTGPFEPSAVQTIVESSDLLCAFLARHAWAEAGNDVSALREQFESYLRHCGHGLTPREVQVCAAIAAGMSSEAIALSFDISLNTVLTFRKRAYARLGLSSQNQLTRLIYRGIASVQ